MKKGFFIRLDELRQHRDDTGAALLSTVILMSVIFILIASVSTTIISATKQTYDNKAQEIAYSSAESGTDAAIVAAATNKCTGDVSSESQGFSYEVYRSASDDIPTGIDDPNVHPGCPETGDRYIVIKSTGTDVTGKDTEIVSAYLWVVRSVNTAEGAIISGSGNMNISTISVLNTGADMVLADGSLDCNNSSVIAGSVYAPKGTVQMSNACKIEGSIYARDGVTINNNAVGVGGDVYSLGNFFMSTAATIQGDVYAKGNLTISSGSRINGSIISSGTGTAQIDNVTIGGSVRTAGPLRLGSGTVISGNVASSSTSDQDLYSTRIEGDLLVNGRFSQLAQSTILGNVISTRSASSNSIAPTATIGGHLTLAGTYSSWGSGPAVSGSITQNASVSSVPVPLFETPAELAPDYFQWRDWSFDESDWTTAGYTVVTLPSCNFQSNPVLVAHVNTRTAPTVYDLRGCSSVQAYGVNFNIRTDIAFVTNGFDNGQQMRVNSADGALHEFNIAVPDLVENNAPTCAGRTVDIYGIIATNMINTFVYTPCTARFGGGSQINGQIYSGVANYSSGGTMTLNYGQVGIPGFPADDNADNRAEFDVDAETRAAPLLVSRDEL